MTDRAAVDAAIARVFRDEAGRITAALLRLLGDFDLAEDATQQAIVLALETWSRTGIPDRPGAWLTAVARNRAIDRLRREARGRERLAELAAAPRPQGSDDRLRLIFTCCHPALAREAQLALTLRAVAGFTTAEVARALLTSETAAAQRIVRAKRTIVAAGVPYRIPAAAELDARVEEVLAVLYLMFNEGYLATGPAAGHRRELAEEAVWLAGLLSRLMPDQPEVLGLLALCRLHHARAAARFAPGGSLVLLQDQDRSLWDRHAITEALRLLERAAATGRVGPYQLQAAIAARHALAPSWPATDWRSIVGLYDRLLAIAPSPVVELNRAIALSHRAGPGPALAAVDGLAGPLDRSHLLHATRAELLTQLGRGAEAGQALRRAADLTRNPTERAHLRQRLDRLEHGPAVAPAVTSGAGPAGAAPL